jgi:hypothetical protein
MPMQETLDFPLIYCNGDSYTSDHHHPSLSGATLAHHVAEPFGGFVINKSRGGSCNRRIIRTTVCDMLEQRKLNPGQKMLALIGLTFDQRSEIWVEQPEQPLDPEESNFRTHAFSQSHSWWQDLLAGKEISQPSHGLNRKYFRKYNDGRAFFFSPCAERINLFCDLIMLRKFLESLDIGFLIFQSPKLQQLSSDFLLDHFRQELRTDPRVLDLEDFSFLSWAHEQGYVPLDLLDTPEIGHHGPEAHRQFAKAVLLPRLIETGQI